MPNILTSGKTFHPQFDVMPIQQEQGASNVFGILDQQYQQETRNIETQFGQLQEETLRKTRYELQKLSEKYQIERSYIEGSGIPIDQMRQKLLQLNNKYELAAITAKSKTKPDIDGYNAQKQQKLGELQQGYQQRKMLMDHLQNLVDRNVIKDPDVALREQLRLVGIHVSTAELKPPKPLTTDELIKQSAVVTNEIIKLEEVLKTATGEEREIISGQILELQNQQEDLQKQLFPGFESTIDKSNKMSKVGLQMSVGRKPGTLSEGVWQKKQKNANISAMGGWAPGISLSEEQKVRSGKEALRLFGLPGNIAARKLGKLGKKKTEEKQSVPIGKIKVISPTGQIGTISTENWEEAKAAGFRRVD